MKQFCDNDCNNCPIIMSDNSRMVSFILNSLIESLGVDKVYLIVQAACPNLTCCADCHIDDFCHVEGCEIVTAAEDRYGKPTAQPLTQQGSKPSEICLCDGCTVESCDMRGKAVECSGKSTGNGKLLPC